MTCPAGSGQELCTPFLLAAKRLAAMVSKVHKYDLVRDRLNF